MNSAPSNSASRSLSVSSAMRSRLITSPAWATLAGASTRRVYCSVTRWLQRMALVQLALNSRSGYGLVQPNGGSHSTPLPVAGTLPQFAVPRMAWYPASVLASSTMPMSGTSLLSSRPQVRQKPSRMVRPSTAGCSQRKSWWRSRRRMKR
ncbi:hypothetical protein D9M71_610700 [compost metagenome]